MSTCLTGLGTSGGLVLAAGAACALAIVYFDFTQFRIPDILSGLLAALGLIWSSWVCDQAIWLTILNGLAAAAAILTIRFAYFRLRGAEGLGLGDVKLAGVIGIWFGLINLPMIVLIACSFALLHLILLQAVQRESVHGKTRLPFGVHLCLACLAFLPANELLLQLNQT